MRFLGLVPLLLVSPMLLLSGCALIDEPGEHRSAFLDRWRPGHEPQHEDLISLDMALVERPIYDGYLDKELWTVVDEQLGSLDSRGELQANGFRVGELGGIPPAEFLRMLTSDRSCINPRSITVHSGGSTKLSLGPALDHSQFDLVQQATNRPKQLDRVQ